MVHTIDMPAVSPVENGVLDSHAASLAKSRSYHSNSGSIASTSGRRSVDSQKNLQQIYPSSEQPTPGFDSVPGGWPTPSGPAPNGNFKEGFGGKDGSALSIPNGTNTDRAPSAKSLAMSARTRRSSGMESERKSAESAKDAASRPGVAEEGLLAAPNGKVTGPPRSPIMRASNNNSSDHVPPSPTRSASTNIVMASAPLLPPVHEMSPPLASTTDGMLKPPGSSAGHVHRASSPPAFSPSTVTAPSVAPPPVRPDRLMHRHTLEVPKFIPRTSQDGVPGSAGPQDSGARFSPTQKPRRSSLQLVRRATRSIASHSDMYAEDAPHDEDAARWTEHIRAKRASKRARVDTDDDRVLVGTKVDEHHENYVRAYNMLTGIRFVVSRTNAKNDHALTDADFEARHKYSFDIMGSELTPSAKYDFKFKDYAPWVFRHLRAAFKLDPAEYLVSLTSKYILSELGSPGKSGSFFYFSRDYKYIIKTIHHGEHKFLRKILKDYYLHVQDNPNTLLSQFYGLHRVKMPYGKKVHFVVMNNLFPPHRDIHRTFDLKGSTIGRDFKEEDLEKNPRATLKDLNWLRRNLHLEFGPTKKEAFVTQMHRDVALLQRLKIMDYSMLVGIHDLGRGNEENLRNKTLQVFQPASDKPSEPQMGQLTRTPSKLETAKRARQLRESVKKERPIPMAQAEDKMPDIMAHKRDFFFYADDGGFQATHEDDLPGEEIYYLGIIDCLTRYNLVKKAEHFWKGFGGHESQISPIPPERYGDRFIKFISGITMSREQAEKSRLSSALRTSAGVIVPEGIEGTIDDPILGSSSKIRSDGRDPAGTEEVMQKAEHEAEKSMEHGASEEDVPDRSMGAIRSPGDQSEAATLPVIGEAAEGEKTPSQAHSQEDMNGRRPVIGNANMPSESVGEIPPPTPPKIEGVVEQDTAEREGWKGRAPPTPPKDEPRSHPVEHQRSLLPPTARKSSATAQLSSSPVRLPPDEITPASRRL